MWQGYQHEKELAGQERDININIVRCHFTVKMWQTINKKGYCGWNWIYVGQNQFVKSVLLSSVKSVWSPQLSGWIFVVKSVAENVHVSVLTSRHLLENTGLPALQWKLSSSIAFCFLLWEAQSGLSLSCYYSIKKWITKKRNVLFQKGFRNFYILLQAKAVKGLPKEFRCIQWSYDQFLNVMIQMNFQIINH